MKHIALATALAVLAGCAELPDRIKHPFASAGASAPSDAAAPSQEANPYPYNPPYGD